MDRHIHDYYRPSKDEGPTGHFHSVICLQKEKERSWDGVKMKAPDLCRGWYELAHLKAKDRVEFTKEFWISKLPFQPGFSQFLEKFFSGIDDVRVYLVQCQFDDPYAAHLIYSLKEGNGFFRGFSPVSDSEITALKQAFPKVTFPEDYLAFLQIHNGFSKTTDSGILKTTQIPFAFEDLQKQIASNDGLCLSGDLAIDPPQLIPFYKSFGMPFYQCFYSEWYPRNEMGNVYYSSSNNTISNLSKKESMANMAFTSFEKWLMFYLEALHI